MSSFSRPHLYNNHIMLQKEFIKKQIKNNKIKEQKILKQLAKIKRREAKMRREAEIRHEAEIRRYEAEMRRYEAEMRRYEAEIQREAEIQIHFNFAIYENEFILNNIEETKITLSDIEFDKLNKRKYNCKYNTTCTICFDDFKLNEEIIQLECNHNYHIECIKEWLCNNSNKCPLCKKDAL